MKNRKYLVPGRAVEGGARGAMAPPIFMPRLEILGQIWCFMSKKASPWKKFKDSWGKKSLTCKKIRGFSRKKSLASENFFGPPNLKILSPSLSWCQKSPAFQNFPFNEISTHCVTSSTMLSTRLARRQIIFLQEAD